MLKGVLITGGSGLLLYSKEIVSFSKPTSLIAGILTAMLEKAYNDTSCFVSFIEYENLCICFATHPTNRTTCIILCDPSDGQEFGGIIAQEILALFLEVFGEEEKDQSGKEHSSFNERIAEAYKNALQPALSNLASKRGIEGVVIVAGDIFYASDNRDKVAVSANWDALQAVCGEMMTSIGDVSNLITWSGNKRMIIKPIDRATLIIALKPNADFTKCMNAVNESTVLLQKILSLS